MCSHAVMMYVFARFGNYSQVYGDVLNRRPASVRHRHVWSVNTATGLPLACTWVQRLCNALSWLLTTSARMSR